MLKTLYEEGLLFMDLLHSQWVGDQAAGCFRAKSGQRI